MDVTDQDMQMVRDFLKEAPFHIKSHFENLVSEHAKEAARVEELEGENKTLCEEESERYQKLQDEYYELESTKQTEADTRLEGALETIRYWLLDVLVHGRPMQKPPRQILRIVEDVL